MAPEEKFFRQTERERERDWSRSVDHFLQTQITVVLTYHWYHQLSNGRMAVAITITKIQNDDPIDSFRFRSS